MNSYGAINIMTRYILTLVLSVSLMPAQIQGLKPDPLVVRFGNLVWIYAAHGLPSIENGRVMVPLSEMCALFSAKCVAQPESSQASVDSNEVLTNVPIVWHHKRQVAFASLVSLARPLGYTFSWDGASKMANVKRTSRTPNGLSGIQGNAYGFDPATSTPTTPLSLQMTGNSDGSVSFNVLGKIERASITIFARDTTGSVSISSEYGVRPADVPRDKTFCSPVNGECLVTLNAPVYAFAVIKSF